MSRRRIPAGSRSHLAERDRHDYGIMQQVSSLTGGKTKLSAGTLYGAIQRLLEQD